MLVVERHVGEAIQIGPDIRVMILRGGSNNVRLGIAAPRAVQIDRISKAGKYETRPKELDDNGDRNGNR